MKDKKVDSFNTSNEEDVFDDDLDASDINRTDLDQLSFDFRTRASFRALIFRTYTFTRSQRYNL